MKKCAFSAPHSYLLLGALILLLIVSGYANICFFRGADPLGIITMHADAEASCGDEERADLKFYFLYSGCGHFDETIPPSLQSVDFRQFDWEQDTIPGWTIFKENNLVIFKQDFTGINPPLEAVGWEGFCSECLAHKYVGIYEQDGVEKVGVYVGDTLIKTTDVVVKADVRAELAEGIPFDTLEEMNDIIESYSS